MSKNIINVGDVEAIISTDDGYWHSFDKPLTPVLEPRIGRLGVVLTRVPPGKSACPFHTHHLEDEVFFILSGMGVFRYGDTVQTIRAGDCISCPAGTGTAHQLANVSDEDLVYLAIGNNDPNEVCTYPDSGKIMVRALRKIGFFEAADYMKGEPLVPRIFDLAAKIE